MTGCAETPKGLSGSALKWIAVGTMLLDHIGAVLIERQVWPLLSETGSTVFLSFGMDVWYEIDLALRLVGRLAFPLFSFLLVEGFLHTRNVKTYALRMGAAAFCFFWEEAWRRRESWPFCRLLSITEPGEDRTVFSFTGSIRCICWRCGR